MLCFVFSSFVLYTLFLSRFQNKFSSVEEVRTGDQQASQALEVIVSILI